MFGLFKTTRERVADLETAVRQLQTIREEWDSFHEMWTRRAARDRKRDRDAVTAAPTGEPEREVGGSAASADPRAARLLRKAQLLERLKARGNGVRA